MIRELCEGSNFALRNQFNANDWIVGMICDLCKGDFLFAAMNFEKAPIAIASTYYQAKLVRFCPFCGARNTSIQEERKRQ